MKTTKEHEGPKPTKIKRKTRNSLPKMLDNFDKNEEHLTSEQSSQCLSYGVLGIGRLGSAIVINLIKTGNKVYIWNRTIRKCEHLVKNLDRSIRSYVEICHIPTLVIKRSDIIFNCISECSGSKEVIRNSLSKELAPDNFMLNKGLIDMSGVDPDGHEELSELVRNKGGKYLEVRIQFQEELKGGGYLFLVGGEADLFTLCESCFNNMGGTSLYIGEKIG